MSTEKQIQADVSRAEVAFFESFSTLQQILEAYHDVLLKTEITQDNLDVLEAIGRGLKNILVGFDNIVDAYPQLCRAKGVDYPL